MSPARRRPSRILPVTRLSEDLDGIFMPIFAAYKFRLNCKHLEELRAKPYNSLYLIHSYLLHTFSARWLLLTANLHVDVSLRLVAGDTHRYWWTAFRTVFSRF